MDFIFLIPTVSGVLFLTSLLTLYYRYLKTKTVEKRYVIYIIVTASFAFICLILWSVLRNIFRPF